MTVGCPLCNIVLESHSDLPDSQGYNCTNCGNFILTGTLVATLETVLDCDEKKAILSHVVRNMQRDDERRPEIDSDQAKQIVKGALPSPNEQADKLIIWLGDNSASGEMVQIGAFSHQALIGAINAEGFYFVMAHLREEGLLDGSLSMGVNAGGNAYLTFDGWNYYSELKTFTSDSFKVFMAMQYGDPKLDKVVEEIFRPAIKQTGFDLFRLDDDPKAGLIDDRLRNEVRTSRFLIADLTHDNEGAYWEAGYAEGLGKPVIYTCEKSKFSNNKSHFDTNHHLTVTWELDKPEETAESLKATIRATLPDVAKLTDD